MNSSATKLTPPGKKSAVPFAHGLYLGVLILYVLAGCRLVPLHGDETTILYMSSDFSTFFLHGDLAHLEYRDPPLTDDPEALTKQQLRIINGVTSKYVYGLSWWLAGFQSSDLNQQWSWGANYAYNQSQNVIPNPVLLFVCRWAAGLMTALSVVIVFLIGRRIGGWRTAYVAAFIYALSPAILVNGRRAVFESTLMLFSSALIYLALRWLNKPLKIRHMVALGIMAGLTIGSKHTGVISIAIAFGALIICPLLARHWSQAARTFIATIGAGIIMAAIFFVLNPSWWGNPLIMPGVVLQQRQSLLTTQVTSNGGFSSPADRVAAMLGQSLLAAPQYFEAKEGWPTWIGGQIVAYEANGVAGLYGARWTFIVGVMAVAGLLRLIFSLFRLIRGDTVRAAPLIAIALWLGVNVMTLYVLTPLDWQRYYLPLVTPMAVLCGLAVMTGQNALAKNPEQNLALASIRGKTED